MKKILLTCFFAGSAFVLSAQEPVFTLNQFSSLIYHPAHVAIDNDASVSYLNRRTQVGSGINYQNNSFQGEYPLVEQKTGKRFGGIGLHVLEKDAGNTDLLQAYTIGLSMAYNLQFANNQFFSLGLQTNFSNKKTSLQHLTTGSQWLATEFRFDSEADIGEAIAQNSINYFAFNAGFLWYNQSHKDGLTRAFVGVAAMNLNKPPDSFLEGDSRIPVGFQVNAGMLAYHSRQIHLSPQLVYQRDNNQNVVNVLLSNRFIFENENPYDIIRSGSVELLGKFDFKNDLCMGIVLHQPGVSLGFSYNFSIASTSTDQHFSNGTEFGIRLSKTIWKARPAKINIENTSLGTKRDFSFSDQQPGVSKEPAQTVSDVDIIQKNIEEHSDVKAVQFHLEKNFHFGFGKAELDAEGKAYLDNFYKLLQKNAEYKLEVIGHTDNVGKHLVNYKLSTARAKAVVDYLRQLGLEESRVKFSGRGDTEPKAANDSEENKAKNRRVEFLIYVNR